MNPSLWNFVPAAGLVLIGAGFAWIERKMAPRRSLLPASMREFALNRSRRRIRVAALMIFVGTLMACGNLTDPRAIPLRFVAIWSLTALLTVSILCYGIADFRASQRMLAGRGRNPSPAEDADVPTIRPPSSDQGD